MMKKSSQVLSALLSLVLVTGLSPVQAFAAVGTAGDASRDAAAVAGAAGDASQDAAAAVGTASAAETGEGQASTLSAAPTTGAGDVAAAQSAGATAADMASALAAASAGAVATDQGVDAAAEQPADATLAATSITSANFYSNGFIRSKTGTYTAGAVQGYLFTTTFTQLKEGTDFRVAGYVSPTDGKTYTTLSDAVVSYDSSQKKYTVTCSIEGLGSYSGTTSRTFTVKDAWNLQNATLTPLNRDSNGKGYFVGDDFSNIFTVKDADGDTLTVNEDYVLKYFLNYTYDSTTGTYYADYVDAPDAAGTWQCAALAVDGSGYYAPANYYSTYVTVADPTDLSTYTYTLSHNGLTLGEDGSLFYTGSSIEPLVFGTLTSYSGAKKTVTPDDVTVTYADEEGNVVTPSAAGTYFATIEPADGSGLTGSKTIRFSIVEAFDFAEMSIGDSYYPTFGTNVSIHAGDYVKTYALMSGAAVWTKDTDDVNFSVAAAGRTLIEGVDYVVQVTSKLVDDASNTIRYLYELVGIGDFAGKVGDYYSKVTTYSTVDIYDGFFNVVEDSQKVLENADMSVNWGNGMVLGSNGTVAWPDVALSGLRYGTDYELEGVYTDYALTDKVMDASGDTWKPQGITYCYLHVVGLGAYEGCSFESYANIVGSDAAAGGLLTVDGAVCASSTDFSTLAVLSGDPTPDVAFQTRGSGVSLYDCSALSVDKQLSSDGTKLTVSVNGTLDGVTVDQTQSVAVVSAYDIAQQATYDGESTVGLTYCGVSYVPDFQLTTYVGDTSVDGHSGAMREKRLVYGTDYKVSSLKRGTKTVTAVNAAGDYTAVLQGIGDWTGTRTVAFSVYAGSSQVDLGACSVELSSDYLATTGSAVTPSVTVKLGSTTLTAGTDYAVSYGNNTAAGTAYVKVTPGTNGKFTGYTGANFILYDAINLETRCYAELVENTGGVPSVVVRMNDTDEVVPTSCYTVKRACRFDGSDVTEVAITGVSGKASGTIVLNYVGPATSLSMTAACTPADKGEKATVTTTLTGADAATYRFYYSADGGSTWTQAAKNATGTVQVTANPTNAARQWKVVATTADGQTAEASFVVTINDPVVATSTVPAAKYNAKATVNVSVSHFGTYGPAKYKYYYSADGGKTWKQVAYHNKQYTATDSVQVTANGTNAKRLWKVIVTFKDGRTAEAPFTVSYGA